MSRSTECCLASTIITIIVLSLLGYYCLPLMNSPRNSNSGGGGNQTVDPLKVGWENDGNGLQVTILNSCDDSWTSIFDEYIDKWDNGSPDSLTLTTEKHSHDPLCEAFTNLIHVCNGNYGDTSFRGRATIWRDSVSRNIVSVLAVLNDYHLESASTTQRKYTMCHELGHAFGLPHTDTNHFNLDLGNCLDYTTRPWLNMNPGQVNFDRLYNLYGSVTADTARRGSLQDAASNSSNKTLVPLSMQMEEYNIVEECLETKSCSECMELLSNDEDGGDTRRMLYKHELGEACEFTLDGYLIEIHKLLVDG